MPKARRTQIEIEQDELESQINIAGQKALLKSLEDPNPTTLRLWAERNGERLKAALEENEALKSADTVPRAEHVALQEQSAALTAELQKTRDHFETNLANERRELASKQADLERREHNLKTGIEEAQRKFAASGLQAVIETLQKLLRAGSREVPDFFKTNVPHPLLWSTFWPEAKVGVYCRLARDSRFNEAAAIEVLHVPQCTYDGWEPRQPMFESTAESREYAREFLKHKGWTDEKITDSVNALVKQHSDRDLARPRSNVYDLMERSQRLHPTPVERVRPSDSVAAKVERPPVFVPEPYPYCDDNRPPLPEYL
jgi:hypothetical protein